MKTVYFIRHAKSSWADASLRDKDRPLNSRGERDAPFMAKLLKESGVQVDAIVSSPANRAFTTATFFAKEQDIKKKDIIIEDDIYEAYVDDVLKIINNLDNQFNTILVFGHNPSFTSLANLFSEDYIPNVPTCGIVKVVSSTKRWSSFDNTNSFVTNLNFPKDHK